MRREFPFTAKDGRRGVVRVSRAADARAANRIVRQIVAEEARTMIVDPAEFWSIRDWRRFRMDWSSRGVWLTAELESHVAGTLNATAGDRMNTRHTAEIGITVSEAARGVGVGRALMEAVEIWAGEYGVRKITLRVFSENERARALYQRMGYEVEGVQKKQVRFRDGTDTDLVLMAKFLS